MAAVVLAIAIAIPATQQQAMAFWPGPYDGTVGDVGWHGGYHGGYHGSWGFHGPYCGQPGWYQPCARAWPQVVPVPTPVPVPVAVPVPQPVPVPVSCCGCGCGTSWNSWSGGGAAWGGLNDDNYGQDFVPGQSAWATQGQSLTQVNNVENSPGAYVANYGSNTAGQYTYGQGY